MKIERVQTGYYRVPIGKVVSDAGHGVQDTVEVITCHIDAGGLTGMGYTYTIGHGGRAVRALIDGDLTPALLGEDAGAIEDLWQKLWRRVHWVGRGGVAAFGLAAVDIALYDLAAKAAGLPLYRFLGGSRKPIPAYGSGVNLFSSDAELLQDVESFLAEGFRAVKVKIGRDDPAEDHRRMAAVRRLVGDGVPLMVDSNMKYTPAQAEHVGRLLEPLNIGWFEEPCAPEDVEGHARLAAALTMPVAMGENLHSVDEFRRYIELRAADIIQLDACVLGGVTPFRKVAAMAQAAGLPITTHYADELHVHLLSAAPNAYMLERHCYRLDPYWVQPLYLQDGAAWAPDRPGHGLEWNLAALRPHAG